MDLDGVARLHQGAGAVGRERRHEGGERYHAGIEAQLGHLADAADVVAIEHTAGQPCSSRAEFSASARVLLPAPLSPENQRMVLGWPRCWAREARLTVEWCRTILVAALLLISSSSGKVGTANALG